MKTKRFKKIRAWIIKAKRADHMVSHGLYWTKTDAQKDFDTMPLYDNDGCGKRSDYEIKRVTIQ